MRTQKFGWRRRGRSRTCVLPVCRESIRLITRPSCSNGETGITQLRKRQTNPPGFPARGYHRGVQVVATQDIPWPSRTFPPRAMFAPRRTTTGASFRGRHRGIGSSHRASGWLDGHGGEGYLNYVLLGSKSLRIQRLRSGVGQVALARLTRHPTPHGYRPVVVSTVRVAAHSNISTYLTAESGGEGKPAQ